MALGVSTAKDGPAYNDDRFSVPGSAPTPGHTGHVLPDVPVSRFADRHRPTGLPGQLLADRTERQVVYVSLSAIFDRFCRAVDMRTLPGADLGLSIVDEIVRSHRGDVLSATVPTVG